MKMQFRVKSIASGSIFLNRSLSSHAGQIEVDGMGALTTLLNYIEGNAFLDPENFSAKNFSLERRTWLLTQAGITSDFLIDMDFIPNLQNTSELIINVSYRSCIDDRVMIYRSFTSSPMRIT